MLVHTCLVKYALNDTHANAKPTKIDGDLGSNILVNSGSLGQYSGFRNSNGLATVISNSLAPIQVNDTLTNIQQIQFTDKTISLN